MRANQITEKLQKLSKFVIDSDLSSRRGVIKEINGPVIRVIMPKARIGDLCYLMEGEKNVGLAEVVGVNHPYTLLSVLNSTISLSDTVTVLPSYQPLMVKVGHELIGHVLDGFGRIINPIEEFLGEEYPVTTEAPDPMTRDIIKSPLGLGVRALDGLLTCGQGQRVGIFAAAGVGKSTLLSMICRHSAADVVVIGLVGERGREVREFIEETLGLEGMKRAVIVMATSDKNAMERVKCPMVATAIAEYFRDQGLKVLLFVDSVTRFARALREVGLAAGEPASRRGYPVSVFSQLSKLLERTGNSDKGSITAIYTVLVEGDDMNEPVADEVRSILDGHIVLSRDLASAGHFPAVDVLKSSSRVMSNIVIDEHLDASIKFRSLLAKYKEIELLIQLGEYESGTDSEADEAIRLKPQMDDFLKQKVDSASNYNDTVTQLLQTFK